MTYITANQRYVYSDNVGSAFKDNKMQDIVNEKALSSLSDNAHIQPWGFTADTSILCRSFKFRKEKTIIKHIW